jgi:hypothetical protein
MNRQLKTMISKKQRNDRKRVMDEGRRGKIIKGRRRWVEGNKKRREGSNKEKLSNGFGKKK